MKKLIVLVLFVLGLISCSNSIPEPETPEVVLNTDRILSLDGPYLSCAFEYDNQGRVVKYTSQDSNMDYFTEYKYDKDRIYVSYQQYRWSNGEYDTHSQYTFSREDTLFLVNGRVDSCAGARQDGNRFFFKYRYNERGEMIFFRNENVSKKHLRNPWYEEEVTYEWKDGNIIKVTFYSPNRYNTTNYNTYGYSSLTGNFAFIEPRSYLTEHVALIANGYFGVACRNLVESVEYSDGYSYPLRYAYELDEHKRLRTITETHPLGEGHVRYKEYNIKWVNTAKLP